MADNVQTNARKRHSILAPIWSPPLFIFYSLFVSPIQIDNRTRCCAWISVIAQTAASASRCTPHYLAASSTCTTAGKTNPPTSLHPVTKPPTGSTHRPSGWQKTTTSWCKNKTILCSANTEKSRVVSVPDVTPLPPIYQPSCTTNDVR